MNENYHVQERENLDMLYAAELSLRDKAEVTVRHILALDSHSSTAL